MSATYARTIIHRTHTNESNIMSEQNTTVPTDTNVTDKPKPRRTRAERTEFTKIIAAHAKRRNIDTTRAGKEVRAKARREFDALCKLDPTLAKAKSHANDGNRWPALNDAARDRILKPAQKK